MADLTISNFSDMLEQARQNAFNPTQNSTAPNSSFLNQSNAITPQPDFLTQLRQMQNNDVQKTSSSGDDSGRVGSDGVWRQKDAADAYDRESDANFFDKLFGGISKGARAIPEGIESLHKTTDEQGNFKWNDPLAYLAKGAEFIGAVPQMLGNDIVGIYEGASGRDVDDVWDKGKIHDMTGSQRLGKLISPAIDAAMVGATILTGGIAAPEAIGSDLAIKAALEGTGKTVVENAAKDIAGAAAKDLTADALVDAAEGASKTAAKTIAGAAAENAEAEANSSIADKLIKAKDALVDHAKEQVKLLPTSAGLGYVNSYAQNLATTGSYKRDAQGQDLTLESGVKGAEDMMLGGALGHLVTTPMKRAVAKGKSVALNALKNAGDNQDPLNTPIAPPDGSTASPQQDILIPAMQKYEEAQAKLKDSNIGPSNNLMLTYDPQLSIDEVGANPNDIFRTADPQTPGDKGGIGNSSYFRQAIADVSEKTTDDIQDMVNNKEWDELDTYIEKANQKHHNDTQVAFSKNPQTGVSDTYGVHLRLRDNQPEGALSIHPLMKNLATLDIDGDNASLYSDRTYLRKPSELLVDYAGKATVDSDFGEFGKVTSSKALRNELVNTGISNEYAKLLSESFFKSQESGDYSPFIKDVAKWGQEQKNSKPLGGARPSATRQPFNINKMLSAVVHASHKLHEESKKIVAAVGTPNDMNLTPPKITHNANYHTGRPAATLADYSLQNNKTIHGDTNVTTFRTTAEVASKAKNQILNIDGATFTNKNYSNEQILGEISRGVNSPAVNRVNNVKAMFFDDVRKTLDKFRQSDGIISNESFLENFIKEYNILVDKYNDTLSHQSIEFKEIKTGIELNKISEENWHSAFTDVYADAPLEYIFGDHLITKDLESQTLSQYIDRYIGDKSHIPSEFTDEQRPLIKDLIREKQSKIKTSIEKYTSALSKITIDKNDLVKPEKLMSRFNKVQALVEAIGEELSLFMGIRSTETALLPGSYARDILLERSVEGKKKLIVEAKIQLELSKTNEVGLSPEEINNRFAKLAGKNEFWKLFLINMKEKGYSDILRALKDGSFSYADISRDIEKIFNGANKDKVDLLYRVFADTTPQTDAKRFVLTDSTPSFAERARNMETFVKGAKDTITNWKNQIAEVFSRCKVMPEFRQQFVDSVNSHLNAVRSGLSASVDTGIISHALISNTESLASHFQEKGTTSHNAKVAHDVSSVIQNGKILNTVEATFGLSSNTISESDLVNNPLFAKQIFSDIVSGDVESYTVTHSEGAYEISRTTLGLDENFNGQLTFENINNILAHYPQLVPALSDIHVNAIPNRTGTDFIPVVQQKHSLLNSALHRISNDPRIKLDYTIDQVIGHLATDSDFHEIMAAQIPLDTKISQTQKANIIQSRMRQTAEFIAKMAQAKKQPSFDLDSIFDEYIEKEGAKSKKYIVNEFSQNYEQDIAVIQAIVDSGLNTTMTEFMRDTSPNNLMSKFLEYQRINKDNPLMDIAQDVPTSPTEILSKLEDMKQSLSSNEDGTSGNHDKLIKLVQMIQEQIARNQSIADTSNQVRTPDAIDQTFASTSKALEKAQDKLGVLAQNFFSEIYNITKRYGDLADAVTMSQWHHNAYDIVKNNNRDGIKTYIKNASDTAERAMSIDELTADYKTIDEADFTKDSDIKALADIVDKYQSYNIRTNFTNYLFNANSTKVIQDYTDSLKRVINKIPPEHLDISTSLSWKPTDEIPNIASYDYRTVANMKNAVFNLESSNVGTVGSEGAPLANTGNIYNLRPDETPCASKGKDLRQLMYPNPEDMAQSISINPSPLAALDEANNPVLSDVDPATTPFSTLPVQSAIDLTDYLGHTVLVESNDPSSPTNGRYIITDENIPMIEHAVSDLNNNVTLFQTHECLSGKSCINHNGNTLESSKVNQASSVAKVLQIMNGALKEIPLQAKKGGGNYSGNAVKLDLKQIRSNTENLRTILSKHSLELLNASTPDEVQSIWLSLKKEYATELNNVLDSFGIKDFTQQMCESLSNFTLQYITAIDTKTGESNVMHISKLGPEYLDPQSYSLSFMASKPEHLEQIMANAVNKARVEYRQTHSEKETTEYMTPTQQRIIADEAIKDYAYVVDKDLSTLFYKMKSPISENIPLRGIFNAEESISDTRQAKDNTLNRVTKNKKWDEKEQKNISAFNKMLTGSNLLPVQVVFRGNGIPNNQTQNKLVRKVRNFLNTKGGMDNYNNHAIGDRTAVMIDLDGFRDEQEVTNILDTARLKGITVYILPDSVGGMPNLTSVYKTSPYINEMETQDGSRYYKIDFPRMKIDQAKGVDYNPISYAEGNIENLQQVILDPHGSGGDGAFVGDPDESDTTIRQDFQIHIPSDKLFTNESNYTNCDLMQKGELSNDILKALIEAIKIKRENSNTDKRTEGNPLELYLPFNKEMQDLILDRLSVFDIDDIDNYSSIVQYTLDNPATQYDIIGFIKNANGQVTPLIYDNTALSLPPSAAINKAGFMILNGKRELVLDVSAKTSTNIGQRIYFPFGSKGSVIPRLERLPQVAGVQGIRTKYKITANDLLKRGGLGMNRTSLFRSTLFNYAKQGEGYDAYDKLNLSDEDKQRLQTSHDPKNLGNLSTIVSSLSPSQDPDGHLASALRKILTACIHYEVPPDFLLRMDENNYISKLNINALTNTLNDPEYFSYINFIKPGLLCEPGETLESSNKIFDRDGYARLTDKDTGETIGKSQIIYDDLVYTYRHPSLDNQNTNNNYGRSLVYNRSAMGDNELWNRHNGEMLSNITLGSVAYNDGTYIQNRHGMNAIPAEVTVDFPINHTTDIYKNQSIFDYTNEYEAKLDEYARGNYSPLKILKMTGKDSKPFRKLNADELHELNSIYEPFEKYNLTPQDVNILLSDFDGRTGSSSKNDALDINRAKNYAKIILSNIKQGNAVLSDTLSNINKRQSSIVTDNNIIKKIVTSGNSGFESFKDAMTKTKDALLNKIGAIDQLEERQQTALKYKIEAWNRENRMFRGITGIYKGFDVHKYFNETCRSVFQNLGVDILSPEWQEHLARNEKIITSILKQVNEDKYNNINIQNNNGEYTLYKIEKAKKNPVYLTMQELIQVSQIMAKLNPLLGPTGIVEGLTNRRWNKMTYNVGRKFGIFNDDINLNEQAVTNLSKNKQELENFKFISEHLAKGNINEALAAMKTKGFSAKEFEAQENGKGIQGFLSKAQNLTSKAVSSYGLYDKGDFKNWTNLLASILAEDHKKTGLPIPTEAELNKMIQEADGAFTQQMFEKYPIQSRQAMNMAKDYDYQRQSAGMLWLMNTLKNKPLTQFLLYTGGLRFPNFAYNFMVSKIPGLNITEYALTHGLIKRAQQRGDEGLADQYRATMTSRKISEAILRDVSTGIKTGMYATCLALIPGLLEPPDDKSKIKNLDEWTFCGHELHAAWWLKDILGPALPFAIAMKSGDIGMIGRHIKDFTSPFNPAFKISGIWDAIMEMQDWDKNEAELESMGYSNRPSGVPSKVTASLASIGSALLIWASQFIQPSVAKQLYQNARTYDVSTSKVYKRVNGQLIIDPKTGQPQEEYTSYEDSQLRKVTKNNPVIAVLMDVLGSFGGNNGHADYLASQMPTLKIADPNQMKIYQLFDTSNPLYAKDPNYKQTAFNSIIAAMTQYSDEELIQAGMVIPSSTKAALTKYLTDEIASTQKKWDNFRLGQGADYTALGNGNYNVGRLIADEAYTTTQRQIQAIKDLYNRVKDTKIPSFPQMYQQRDTQWLKDETTGQWYRSNIVKNAMPILPFLHEANNNTTERETTKNPITGEDSGLKGADPINNKETSTTSSLPNTNLSYPSSSSGSSAGSGGRSSSNSEHLSLYDKVLNLAGPRVTRDDTLRDANFDYLRPNVTTSGSRGAYRRGE
jgi:hypothetical protein